MMPHTVIRRATGLCLALLLLLSASMTIAPARAQQPVSDAIEALAKANVMHDAGFKSAYLRALGPLKRETWLISMEGPGTQRVATVAGTRYLLVTTCKPHDCGDNNMVVVYAMAPQALYGEVWRGGKLTAIGNPPPPLAAELTRIWKAEWPGH